MLVPFHFQLRVCLESARKAPPPQFWGAILRGGTGRTRYCSAPVSFWLPRIGAGGLFKAFGTHSKEIKQS